MNLTTGQKPVDENKIQVTPHEGFFRPSWKLIQFFVLVVKFIKGLLSTFTQGLLSSGAFVLQTLSRQTVMFVCKGHTRKKQYATIVSKPLTAAIHTFTQYANRTLRWP